MDQEVLGQFIAINLVYLFRFRFSNKVAHLIIFIGFLTNLFYNLEGNKIKIAFTLVFFYFDDLIFSLSYYCIYQWNI